MHISYKEGYADALRDVFCWFENHQPLFAKKTYKMVSIILSRFQKHKDDFFHDKECYEFEFTPDELKAAGIKIFPPEPPHWNYKILNDDGHCYGYCPKCKQEQFFFSLNEMKETEECRICKTPLLPPKEEK